MDHALFLKTIHVLAACAWFGGVVAYAVLVLGRAADRATQMRLLAQLRPLGPRLFVPSSVAVVISGPLLAWVAGWGAPGWIWAAAAGAAASVALGSSVLAPGLQKVEMLLAYDEIDWAADVAHGMRWAARLDLAILTFVICLMVVKPEGAQIAVTAFPAVAVASALFAMDALARPSALSEVSAAHAPD